MWNLHLCTECFYYLMHVYVLKTWLGLFILKQEGKKNISDYIVEKNVGNCRAWILENVTK